jgi:hypothetical protein
LLMPGLYTPTYGGEWVAWFNSLTSLQGCIVFDCCWGRKSQNSEIAFTNGILPRCVTQCLRNSHPVMESCYNQLTHVWAVYFWSIGHIWKCINFLWPSIIVYPKINFLICVL